MGADPQLLRRAWQALIEKAAQHRTMTYEEIAVVVGWRPGAGRAVGRWILEPIRAYCESNGLPPLTSLVVKKGSGKPGRGLIRHIGDDVYMQQMRVFAHQWAKPRTSISDGSNGEEDDTTSIKNGGQALPRPASTDRLERTPDGMQFGTPHQAGMSLRDWFAGQYIARARYAFSPDDLIRDEAVKLRAQEIARIAYILADAMVEARG